MNTVGRKEAIVYALSQAVVLNRVPRSSGRYHDFPHVEVLPSYLVGRLKRILRISRHYSHLLHYLGGIHPLQLSQRSLHYSHDRDLVAARLWQ